MDKILFLFLRGGGEKRGGLIGYRTPLLKKLYGNEKKKNKRSKGRLGNFLK